jgi:hypothetical protein
MKNTFKLTSDEKKAMEVIRETAAKYNLGHISSDARPHGRLTFSFSFRFLTTNH